MKNNRIASIIALFLFTILILASQIFAAPIGPSSVNNLGTSRYTTAGASNISAIAGNVTEINFFANTVTTAWQGYFGNVTGTIVLGNSNNQTLYNWNLTTPRGQIYATRTSSVPAWTSIRCANLTEIATEDTALGVNQSSDQDSVNRTFTNTTSFSSFYVGGVNISTTQNCFATLLHNSTGQPSSNFAEVLLSDTSSAMIYTALIAQPATGFDGRSHQFQMLVGENGHLDDASTTPYYFYLELR